MLIVRFFEDHIGFRINPVSKTMATLPSVAIINDSQKYINISATVTLVKRAKRMVFKVNPKTYVVLKNQHIIFLQNLLP